MSACKTIQCPLYGPVTMVPLALRLIDTPEFQRLHSIKQTGLAYRVFPSACHSRFAHAIGTYHLAGIWVSYLKPDIQPRLRLLIQLAGLLHDIGHGPFSHTFEAVVQRHVEKTWTHESQSVRIVRHMVAKYKIPLNETELELICNCILPTASSSSVHAEQPWVYQVVHNGMNGLDVDKMDYLRRDMQTIGLVGNVDVLRILMHSSIHPQKGHIIFDEKVASPILDLYYQRYKMYRTIYQHRVILAFDRMMEHIMVSIPALQQYICDLDQFCTLTDDRIFTLSTDTVTVSKMHARVIRTYTTPAEQQWSDTTYASIVGSNLHNETAIRNVEFTSGRTLIELELPMVRLCTQLTDRAWLRRSTEAKKC